MSFFKKLFRKNTRPDTPRVSSWENIVEIMRDKYLDTFSCEVVEVIYSKDYSMRYVVLKDEKGLFTYQLEAIYQFDEEEWKYICSDNNTLPAMWEPFPGICETSVFEDKEKLLIEIKHEPEYKKYFV